MSDPGLSSSDDSKATSLSLPETNAAEVVSAEVLSEEESDLVWQHLPPKRGRFVEEMMRDPSNASGAALRAGYSAAMSTTLMRDPIIARVLAKLIADRAQRVAINKEEVLNEMAILATSSLEHYRVDPKTGDVTLAPNAPSGAMRAIQSIKRKFDNNGVLEVEIKLWDKPAPLKLVGQHVGLFPDKRELSGPNGAAITVERIERIIVDPKG